MRTARFYKTNPQNFTPQERTPWAGTTIASIKKAHGHSNIPNKIGESWEISTTSEFPSQLSQPHEHTTLRDAIAQDPQTILGRRTFNQFGDHCPILLKWIEASSPLSVQIHPSHSHENLQNHECGKPEAWLVLSAQSDSSLFLGLRSSIAQTEIENLIRADHAELYLHRITPKPFDFISIPAGCVHALGAGILILEPQIVLPNKIGVTWRISDWKRKYNSDGLEDINGKTRALHTDLAQKAIDWSLPKGEDIERTLARQVTHEVRFLGNSTNPFGAQIFTQAGTFTRNQLFMGEFELVTAWGGACTLTCAQSGEQITLTGGESALVSAQVTQMKLEAKIAHGNQPGIAFFSLNPESTAWRS